MPADIPGSFFQGQRRVVRRVFLVNEIARSRKLQENHVVAAGAGLGRPATKCERTFISISRVTLRYTYKGIVTSSDIRHPRRLDNPLAVARRGSGFIVRTGYSPREFASPYGNAKERRVERSRRRKRPIPRSRGEGETHMSRMCRAACTRARARALAFLFRPPCPARRRRPRRTVESGIALRDPTDKPARHPLTLDPPPMPGPRLPSRF